MKNTHAYCRNCEAIRPVNVSVMGGDDISGDYTNATDWVCSDCAWIMVCTYAPKSETHSSGGGLTHEEMVEGLRARGDPLSFDAANAIIYLRAQEELLEDWQQRAKRAEEAMAEVQRPLDAQMARLNARVVELNEENDRLRKQHSERGGVCAHEVRMNRETDLPETRCHKCGFEFLNRNTSEVKS